MGRHSRSRSRSRSKSSRRQQQHRNRDRDDHRGGGNRRDRDRSPPRKDRDRRKSRSRSKDRREQRTSRFDVDPSGGRDQRGPRANKFSDKPPDASMSVYDPNAAKLEAQNLISAITINPEARDAQNELVNRQSDLFSSMLQGARYEGKVNTRVETIRPSMNNMAMDPFKSAFGKNLSDTGLANALNDTSKIKRKIYIPKDSNFNFTGLIIGPKGANQKRLEEQTGCKILVRGKGSQKEGAPPQPDDDEDLHVLIIGDNEFQLSKATAEIERIIFADEETRIKIRQEQLRLVAEIKNNAGAIANKGERDMSMTTPYGPPSEDAFVIRVPNDCVGLVIGKGGETIRQLQQQSGAKKVQVAAESNKGMDYRNLFVEGDREAYDIVQQMVRDIVDQQRKIKQSMTGVLPDNTQGIREEVSVPDNLVGLIIGRGGETVKSINQRTGAVIFIPKECDPSKDKERLLIVSGTPDQVAQAKMEIQEKVNEGMRNMQLKALQAQGIPIQLITSLGLTDPVMLQQYLASFDPTYAAMYQQMYAQQPVVTTVSDSSSLPGSQVNYQGASYNQMPNYGMMPEYMNTYQGQGMQMQGMGGMPGMQDMQGMQAMGMQGYPMQGNPADLQAQMAAQQQFYQQQLPQQNGNGQ